ncbi:MAG: hypothetical protein ABR517_08635 [Thermoanaerobaculia bacterium]
MNSASSVVLETPLEATFSSANAHVVELGAAFALVESALAAAPRKRSWLTFRAGGEIFRLPAEVSACHVDRSRSISSGRLHYLIELEIGALAPSVLKDLQALVAILQISAPASQMTEALQFEIVGF